MGVFLWLWKHIREFFGAITVEPAYFTFALSQGLYMIVSSELYISKVCKVNLALGEEICNNIQQHKEEQVQVQQYASTLKIYNSILQAVPSVIFALFAGPWSDTNGRKLLIVSSLFGFVFNNAVFMINTYWFYELKAEYLLFECLQDCTGGFVCFFMAVNAYMVDVTSEKNRTKRIAFMSGLWPIGSNLGKALSGVIKNRLGFMYNFGLGMLLSLFAMVYVIIFVKDSFQIRKERLKRELEESNDEKKEIEKDEEGAVDIKGLFDLSNLLTGFKAMFAKRPHNMRMYLLLMAFCFELEMFINVGEWSNDYLYLRRQLNFTITEYTRFTTIVGVIGITAQYITIPIMSNKLKLHDSTIVLIDIAGCFFQAVILACATAEWMLYVGAVIAFLDATSFTMIRCMISKNVGQNEIGKLFAIIGAVQAFIPIVSSPIFGLLYRATVKTFPQAYVVLLAALFVVDWFILFFVDRGMRRIARIKEAEKDVLAQEKLLSEKKDLVL